MLATTSSIKSGLKTTAVRELRDVPDFDISFSIMFSLKNSQADSIRWASCRDRSSFRVSDTIILMGLFFANAIHSGRLLMILFDNV